VFSFCVTAYEALCGVRPAALSRQISVDPQAAGATPRRPPSRGGTSAQIARLPAPAAGRRPPRRLLRRLARGLQADPGLRWPSVPPLLQALERDARPLRPWHVGLVAVLAVAGATAAVRLGDDSCTTAAASIASTWSPSDRSWLAPAFAAAAPGQSEAPERAARFLDAYAERWQAAYRDACQAMRRGTQARQLGALRLACLEARRQEAAAMVDLLRHASAGAVRKSIQAVLELPGVSGCGEAEALSAPIPPPDEGPARQRIDELAARLARVSAEEATGDPRAGPDAEALAAEADKAGFAPLQAAVSLALGSSYERLGNGPGARNAYFRAVIAAERGRAEAIRARAAARLAWELGHTFTQFE
jgi:hypothetical protein